RAARAERLDLCAGEDDPGLVPVEQLVLVPGPPVVGDELRLGHRGDCRVASGACRIDAGPAARPSGAMSEVAAYREPRRSRGDRMLGGVCGGLGAYFDVNPAFYRVGFVLLALLGGAGIVIYGACLLVIPNEGERESIASEALRNRRRRPALLIGLVLVGVAG